MARRDTATGTLAAASLAVLAAQLDSGIVNLVLPRLGTQFGTGMAGLQWVLDAYNLSYAALLLPGGAMADRFGRRRLFLVGLAVLTLATLGCAAATDAPALVAARAVAGLGAALALPASLALVNLAFPEEAARRRALGAWAACNGLALAVGPTAGGWLLDLLGWRAVFLAVAPLPAAALLLAGRTVAESRDPETRPLPWCSLTLATLVLGGFSAAAIGLPEALREGRILVPAMTGALAALALLGFHRREVVRDDADAVAATPLLPPALLRAPGFAAAIGATAAMTFGIYGMLMLVPLHLMAMRDLGAAQAGLALLPLSLVFVLVSRRSGPIAGAIGTPVAVAAGLGLMAAGLLGVAAGLAAPGLVPIIAALAVAGTGLGLTTGPVLGAATAAAPPGQGGIAAALANVARMAGATLGVAVLGAAHAALGGLTGLRVALALGAAAQLAGAALAMRGIPRQARPRQAGGTPE